MLKEIHKISDIHYGQMMCVYEQSNRDQGRLQYPQFDESEQLNLAEQELYQYLKSALYDSSAIVAVWVVQGQYVAALRLEHYRDGYLLTALETAPRARGKGYATELVRAILERYTHKNIYSHISINNPASLHLHEKCGFVRLQEFASYLDGSVSNKAVTYIYPKRNQPDRY